MPTRIAAAARLRMAEEGCIIQPFCGPSRQLKHTEERSLRVLAPVVPICAPRHNLARLQWQHGPYFISGGLVRPVVAYARAAFKESESEALAIPLALPSVPLQANGCTRVQVRAR